MNRYKPVELLLVEDNPFDEELTLKTLRKHHLANDIHIVRDGAEALEFVFGPDGATDIPVAPRLVLLDLNLPKISGIEVLRRLKSDPRTRTTPVVVMTSSEEEVDLVASYQLGVNGYVVKPVDFVQYAKAVATLGMYWLLCNAPPPAAASGHGDE